MKLLGEGADDAGGVFDDTITEMCQVGCQVFIVKWKSKQLSEFSNGKF